jgi:hypothetical protein
MSWLGTGSMDWVRKICIVTGYTNDHSKQLMLVVNMTFSMHKELVPSHGKVNII